MGISGINAAAINAEFEKLASSAQRVAVVSTPAGKDVSIAAETAVQITSGAAVKANCSVIRTQDEMVGSLLDILT